MEEPGAIVELVVLEHGEDGVQEFAHDGDEALHFGLAAGQEMEIESAEMRFMGDSDQGGHVEGAAQVAGQRVVMGGSTSRLRHSDVAGSTTMAGGADIDF